MKSTVLIPYPFGAGASKPGAEQGPTYLKQHGLDAALAALGVPVSWHDDPDEVFKRSPFGPEFHGDANTPQTSPSQAFHGMPVAALMGLGDRDFAALGGGAPVIRPEHVVYIGARDLDEGEIKLFKEKNIRVFGMDEIRRLGVDAVFQQAARIATKGTDRLCMSVDLDAFDPADAPATGSLTPDGLRRKDVLPALAALAAQVDFDLLEIVEFNPSRGGAELTFDLIRDLLAVILKAQAIRRNSTAA
jgi:arginase